MNDPRGSGGTPPNDMTRASTIADPGVRAFLTVALIEAVSYLALVAASLSHRLFDTGNYVPYVGLVHGVVFLVYLGLAWTLRSKYGWDAGTMIVIVLASVVPLGTLFVERQVALRPVEPNLLHGWVMRGTGRNDG